MISIKTSDQTFCRLKTSDQMFLLPYQSKKRLKTSDQTKISSRVKLKRPIGRLEGETMMETLIQTLRQAREAHRLTQEQLAKMAGVSLASLSRLERGKETIRLDVLMKVANCLGYRIELVPRKRFSGGELHGKS